MKLNAMLTTNVTIWREIIRPPLITAGFFGNVSSAARLKEFGMNGIPKNILKKRAIMIRQLTMS